VARLELGKIRIKCPDHLRRQGSPGTLIRIAREVGSADGKFARQSGHALAWPGQTSLAALRQNDFDLT
jgi:hypothetical protein